MYRRLFCLRVAITLLFACAAFVLLTLAPPADAAELQCDPAHAGIELPSQAWKPAMPSRAFDRRQAR